MQQPESWSVLECEEEVVSRVSAQHLSRTKINCPYQVSIKNTLISRILFRGNKNILVLEIAGVSRIGLGGETG